MLRFSRTAGWLENHPSKNFCWSICWYILKAEIMDVVIAMLVSHFSTDTAPLYSILRSSHETHRVYHINLAHRLRYQH